MSKLKALAAALAAASLAFAAPAVGAPETSPEYLYHHVKASYYKMGRMTASGLRFHANGFTAAHRTLPFGTRLRVTNCINGKSVWVTITDRGPFIKGRTLDLSYAAAREIDMIRYGVARVDVEN